MKQQKYCLAIVDASSPHNGYIRGCNSSGRLVDNVHPSIDGARFYMSGVYRVVKLNKAICSAYRQARNRDNSGNFIMPIKDLEIVEP